MVENDNGGELYRNKKNQNLTEAGQCRRLRDSWWRMIMVVNYTEIKKGKSTRNWAIQAIERLLVANQTEIKKRKSNRNWAIQAIERLMVANDNGGEIYRNKKKRKSNRNWAIQAIERLVVANQTEIKKN